MGTALYELIKETIFSGQLSAWESHTITIFMAATFATIAAYFVRRHGDRLTFQAQEAQKRAESVINNLFDGLVIIDSHGIISAFNPAAEKIFGYTAEEAIGANINILIPEPYINEYGSYIQQSLKTPHPGILGKSLRNINGQRASGEVFPMDLMASQMHADGQTMFIAIVRDITAYKQAAEERQRLQVLEKRLHESLRKEVSIAAAIQRNMIPDGEHLFYQYPQVRAYATALPAKEMGGDFFDAIAVDGEHIAFAIGDVSGKGIPAALFMMRTMSLLRPKLAKPGKFANCLASLNRLLCKNNEANMFVTLFIGLLNVTTGKLQYMNAGHMPPLLGTHAGQYAPLPVPRNMLLGIHEGASYELHELQMQPGDTLVLYTDGVTEAENLQREQFSLERTVAALQSIRGDVRVMTRKLLNEVTGFSDSAQPSDDITVFTLQFAPEASRSADTLFFEWSAALSVAIPEIDEQHKGLAALINEIYDEVLARSASPDRLQTLLDLLVQRTEEHFHLEEKLLADYAPLGAVTHGFYHRHFEEQLGQLRVKLLESTQFGHSDLLILLKNWFHEHIASADREIFLDIAEAIYLRQAEPTPFVWTEFHKDE